MLNKIKNKLSCNKGEGYIDVIILILCSVFVIALAINVFQAYIAKQKVDTFATEIMREAEIVGRVGTETLIAEENLKEELGINPTVTWSRSGNVQLNHEIEVTVTLEMDIGLFGNIASFPVTLEGVAMGKSEVYHK